MKVVHGDLESKPIAMLRNPKIYLKHIKRELGYDSCHKIEGIDASRCAQDCEKWERSEFANKCARRNGLFKCCIRYNHCHIHNLTIALQGEIKNFAMNVDIVAPFPSALIKMGPHSRNQKVSKIM